MDAALIDPAVAAPHMGLPAVISPRPRRIRFASALDVMGTTGLVKMVGQKNVALTGRPFSTGFIVDLNWSGTLTNGEFVENHLHVVSAESGQPFALGGDSGAVLVIDDALVGILRAADEATGDGLACHIAFAAECLGFFPP